MIDACAVRQNAMEQVLALIDASGLPVYAAPMGKAAIAETHPQYRGIYMGLATPSQVIKDEVAASDFCLDIGAVRADSNSGGFTYRVPPHQTIELHTRHTCVFYAVYENVGMKSLLPPLTAAIRAANIKISWNDRALPIDHPSFEEGSANSPISQAYLWPTIASHLRSGDIVVAETGTASFGILASPFPPGVTCLSQVMWGSIGWSVGAAVGASIANPTRRVILLVGDGSFQLTAPELSTAARHGLRIVVFLLNNDGYTIERLIRSPTSSYNDILMWKYDRLWKFFGAQGQACSVSTRAELTDALTSVEDPKENWLIELRLGMGRLDAPIALRAQMKQAKKNDPYGERS
jgi:pyruvate decarboxylase